MTPATLHAAAAAAATRGEWIKAAALKDQADDLERARRFGRDPYSTIAGPRAFPAVTSYSPAQRREASRMLSDIDMNLEP